MDSLLSARAGRGCTVVEVRGDLDLATVTPLRDGLQPLVEGSGQVVLDLTGVGFMDSSTLGTLVVMFKTAREHGGRLCLAGVQPTVATVLRITLVDQVIDVYDTVRAAEDNIAAGGLAARPSAG